MKSIHVLERDAALEQGTHPTAPEDCAVNMTVVYQDAHTRSWAQEVSDRVTKVTGKDWIRATWWKISDLVEPGVLAGAVSTAMRAQLIVVAIDAAEGLPLPFHVWVDTWLPHRPHGAGCLFALIGRSEPGTHAPQRVREYLREVARMGGFEFLLEERRLPMTPAAPARVRSRTSVDRTKTAGAQRFLTASCTP